MQYTLENGEAIPTLAPLWPLGAPITVEVVLSTPDARHGRDHAALAVFQRRMRFDPETAGIDEVLHVCGTEGLRQGVCSLQVVGGITLEGASYNRSIPLHPDPQAVHRAKRFAEALQRGRPVVARVSVRLDSAVADQARVSKSQRSISSRNGDVRLIKQQVYKPKPRQAFLLTNISSKEQAWAKETKAAPEGAWQPTAGGLSAHFVTSLDVQIVCDDRPIPVSAPPQIVQSLQPVPGQYKYLPTVFANPVDPPSDRLSALNGSFVGVSFHIQARVVPPARLVLMHVMSASLNNLGAMFEGESMQKELDDVTRLVTETPAWLLALTLAVSVVHLWLDVLAIQSDISFWARTSSLRGISRATLATQAVSEIVITLYLWDQGASLLVVGPAAAYALVQVWKLVKSCGLRPTLLWWVVPWLQADTELFQTSTEANTGTHDIVAATHMLMVLSPLVLGGTLYSLIFQEHESWQQWMLQTAVSVVYSFGFALMTPQLYVNYKLKSVAALNWQGLVYRSMGTFVDDLFAFVIRSPLMHRLSVFRDDAVFMVYLYQRWIYPVDTSRRDTGATIADVGDQQVASDARVKPCA